MTRRVAIAVGVAAAVLIVAVLSLYGVRSERPGPAPGASPTSTASPTLAAATPTATATSAAAASPSPTAAAATDRYGYVALMGPDQIVVRRERDNAPLFELVGASAAVSLDGKRLAYWRTTPNVGATDLRVIDVADPRSDRSVFTLTGQTVGGAVVWSNDGQGLLVVTQSREMFGHCFAQSTVVMLDLATTPPTTRSATEQGSSACVYLPLAWDRPGQVAAAVVTGPGGVATEYVTWNGNTASPFARAPVPREVIADRVQASADAKLVMGQESNLSVLRVWPILDITQAETIRNPFPLMSASWRPGPTAPYEVIWAVGRRIELFRYRTDSVTTLYTASEEFVGIVAVRPDGSGVLIRQSGGGPPPLPTRLIVLDVATQQTTESSTIAIGGVRALSRGVLLR